MCVEICCGLRSNNSVIDSSLVGESLLFLLSGFALSNEPSRRNRSCTYEGKSGLYHLLHNYLVTVSDYVNGAVSVRNNGAMRRAAQSLTKMGARKKIFTG